MVTVRARVLSNSETNYDRKFAPLSDQKCVAKSKKDVKRDDGSRSCCLVKRRSEPTKVGDIDNNESILIPSVKSW